VSAESVLSELETIGANRDQLAANVTELSLTGLAQYIVRKHHTFTASELARLAPLLAKVRSKHESNHPELADVAYAFGRLASDLFPHMLKEKRVLFPYLAALEKADAEGTPLVPPPFMTVKNPVRMMSLEHDAAGDLLAELRAATGGFEVPEGACMSFRALYEGLAELEADLHEHIHLENNVLFPKAVALEEKLLGNDE
jgi:regulator of cell morphogenesis and NO signaling